MPNGMSRREFLKASATATSAIYLGPHFSEPKRTPDADHIHDTAAESMFTPLPSESPLGTPLTDISMGWDGTLWAINADGVPHLFNRDDDTWYVYGRGIDAIAWGVADSASTLVFRGDEYTEGGNDPEKIAATWPDLPPSFHLGVDGAANVNGSLYLFKAGQYALADMSVPAAAVTSLTGWPDTDTWRHGVVDAVGSVHGSASTLITLFRNDEFVVVDMEQTVVTDGPSPLSSRYAGDLLAVMQQGIDAVAFRTDAITVYQGPVQWESSDDRTTGSALPFAFRREWHPTFAHAPAGRVGGLWSIAPDGATAYHHDGDDWLEVQPPGDNLLTSVAADVDGLVLAITDDSGLHRLDVATGEWTRLATASVPLRQISTGNADHIFVRDATNEIHRFDARDSSFAPIDVGVPATQIAASFDGTVWHCNDGTAQAYRHVAASSAPSQALTVAPNVTGITAVATTGFGVSHALVEQGGQRAIYAYDSPYLMKTAGAYQSTFGRQMSVGAGCLFFSYYDPEDDSVYHACIDAHTGERRWRTLVKDKNVDVADFKESVFDPQFHVIYVALDNDVVALDVQTGDEVWRYAQSFGPIVTRPSLRGTLLCVVTDDGAVHAFDTAQAYRSAQQHDAITPLWTWIVPPTLFPGALAPQPPTITSDAIYVAIWNRFVGQPGWIGLLLVKLSTADGRGIYNLAIHNPTAEYAIQDLAYVRTVQPVVFPSYVTPVGPGEIRTDTVVVGWNNLIAQYSADDLSQIGATYEIAHDDQITSGLTVDRTSSDDSRPYSVPVCVFGTTGGAMHAVQLGPSAAEPIWNTPYHVAGGITTTPYIRQRDDETPIVHFGSAGSTALWSFDTASGEAVQIGTGATSVSTIVPTSNDVVYAGGFSSLPNAVAQYFAIRLPDAVFNDFVIESQLMEDRDQDATKLTRYQTHITIVDDEKLARSSQMVKVWAQDAVTVEIDGQSYDIDASTPAMFHTDATGSLTVVSDATDTFAVPLRLWAEFMDPHERIVIYPDREFHERLTTPTADPSAGQDDIDPTTVNLSTAKAFDGTSLCDTQDQAESTAHAISQTWAAVQQRSNSTTAAAHAQIRAGRRGPRGRRTTPQRRRKPTTRPLPPGAQRRPSSRPTPPGWQRRGGPAPTPPSAPGSGDSAPTSKYIAYPDLLGSVYFAQDTPAARQAVAVAPTGFELDEAQGFTELSVAASAAAVDALEGEDVTPTLLGADDVAGFFKNLWDKIKRLGSAIKKIVVSVGRDIYIGLQYVEDGLNKVVRAVVRTVEDVASAVGAFFVKLGKLIEHIVQALTILFHFDRIKDTAFWITDRFHDLSNDLSNIVDGFIGHFDTFFTGFTGQIDTAFERLIAELDSSTGSGLTGDGTIGGLHGMGTTAHTAFTVGPNGQQQQATSHAVQCSWAAHKVRHHYKQATPSDDLGDVASDPFTQLLTSAIDHIVNDAQLGAALDEAKAQFHRKLKIASADDFFRAAVADLLEVLKVIVVGALTVVKDFIDEVAKGMPETIADLGTLEIPVISALWHAITGKTLTFLDLIAFVLAIPITIVYRIIEGAWPPATDSDLATDAQIVRRLGGLVGGMALIFAGWFTAVTDTLYIIRAELPFAGKVVTGVVGIFLLLAQVGANLQKLIASGSELYFVLTFLSIVSLIVIPFAALTGRAAELTFVNVMIVALQLGTAVLAFVATPREIEQWALIGMAVGALAVIINPVKLLPADSLVPFIAPDADLACRAAAGGLRIATTVDHWNDPA